MLCTPVDHAGGLALIFENDPVVLATLVAVAGKVAGSHGQPEALPRGGDIGGSGGGEEERKNKQEEWRSKHEANWNKNAPPASIALCIS